ncbi:MAG: glycosyltransferase family 9 protein [Burkholderiales bacterium]|nr:glycosyltransferase family 9 protein [Burkholderiales bacterium]
MLRFLIIRADRIGDAIITQVAVEALFKSVECEIDVLASNYSYKFYENNPYIHTLFYCDLENKAESANYFKSVVKGVVYDIIFVLQARRRLQKFSLLTYAKYRCGFDLIFDDRRSTDSFQWFMHKVYKFNYVPYNVNQHELFNLMQVINNGLALLQLPPVVNLPEKCNLYSTIIKSSNKLPNSVAINISGKHEQYKNILPSMLMSLLLLLSKTANKIAIIATAEDKIIAQNMVAFDHDLQEHVEIISDNNVLIVANLLNAFEYFIGADGGLLHIAAALGLKCVGLYNDAVKDLWHPWTPTQVCLSSEIAYNISPVAVMDGLYSLGFGGDGVNNPVIRNNPK